MNPTLPTLQQMLQMAAQDQPGPRQPGPRQPGSLPMPRPSGFVPERAPQMPALGGPFGLSGETLDALAQQLLRSSQQFRPRSDFEGFLSGLAGGLAGTRVQSMNERQAFNAGEQERALERTKGNVEFEKERRKAISDAARSLGTHRQQLARDKALAEQKAAEEKLQREWQSAEKEKDRRAYGYRGGSGGGAAVALDNADAVADAIASYQISPLLGNRMTKDVSAILAALRKRHPNFNHAKAITDWNNTQRFNQVANDRRGQTMRSATETVARHLRSYEKLVDAYNEQRSKTPYRLVNKTILQAAKEGLLGDDAHAAAVGMEALRGALVTEIAIVLGGGYAPHESQLREATDMVQNIWSNKGQRASFNAIKDIIRGRVIAAQNVLPFAGGKDNPYMLEVTPLDVYNQVFGDAEPENVAPPASWDNFLRVPK